MHATYTHILTRSLERGIEIGDLIERGFVGVAVREIVGWDGMGWGAGDVGGSLPVLAFTKVKGGLVTCLLRSIECMRVCVIFPRLVRF